MCSWLPRGPIAWPHLGNSFTGSLVRPQAGAQPQEHKYAVAAEHRRQPPPVVASSATTGRPLVLEWASLGDLDFAGCADALVEHGSEASSGTCQHHRHSSGYLSVNMANQGAARRRRCLATAYLVGTYPAVSHTFIVREIAGLRDLGVDVHTFSVRRPSTNQLLTDEDRQAAERTPSIQPPDPRLVLESHRRGHPRALEVRQDAHQSFAVEPRGRSRNAMALLLLRRGDRLVELAAQTRHYARSRALCQCRQLHRHALCLLRRARRGRLELYHAPGRLMGGLASILTKDQRSCRKRSPNQANSCR